MESEIGYPYPRLEFGKVSRAESMGRPRFPHDRPEIVRIRPPFMGGAHSDPKRG